LPTSIRQALGVDAGDKVAFELHDDGQVIVSRVCGAHRDPAINAFLSVLAQDIEAGRHVRDLPEDLARAMLDEAGYALDGKIEEIDGDVAL